jgi:type IV pilus assembly protein PilQ
VRSRHQGVVRCVAVVVVIAGLLLWFDHSTLAAPPARFSMELRDADIRDVLRVLGQEDKLNVIFGDDVQGKLTLSFRDVTLQGALEAILHIQNLSSIQEGNILRIVRSPLAAGEEQLVTSMFPIQYADVEELSTSIRPLLSSQGRLTVDKRTSTLVIRDIAENIKRIQTVVTTLDERTPQVLIEAKIVEAEVGFARELGIQWGTHTVNRGRGLGPIGVGGLSATGEAGLAVSHFLVNLPVVGGPGVGGASGFSFGHVPNTFQLDLQLTALQNSGRGRILSSPKFLTQNNKEAKVSTGLTIPVLTSTVVMSGVATPGGAQGSQATTGVQNIDVNLSLTVTPHVTPMDHINLKLLAEEKDANFGLEVQGIPTLLTREASTEMIARDGETVVIGGIYNKTECTQLTGVPLLSKIPWLGWLFKKASVVEGQKELLIFVTPHLYRDGAASVSSLASP